VAARVKKPPEKSGALGKDMLFPKNDNAPDSPRTPRRATLRASPCLRFPFVRFFTPPF